MTKVTCGPLFLQLCGPKALTDSFASACRTVSTLCVRCLWLLSSVQITAASADLHQLDGVSLADATEVDSVHIG